MEKSVNTYLDPCGDTTSRLSKNSKQGAGTQRSKTPFCDVSQMRIKAFDKFQRQVVAGQTQTHSPANRQPSSRITYRSPECKQNDKDKILSSFNKQILFKPPSSMRRSKAERSPNTTERSTVHDI